MITAKQIRAGRNLLHMSQDQLALDAGIDASILMDIETGRTRPGSAHAMALQNVMERLGVQFLPGDKVGLRQAHIDSF